MPSSASDPLLQDAVAPYHPMATRLTHIGLALCIIVQLATSQFMHAPHRERPGDTAFLVHEIAGFAALALAFVFWVIVLTRRSGTPLGVMVPWFSGRRLRALWQDVVTHLRALLRARLPAYEDNAPLASAVHGLGLALMLVMAVTGTIWFFAHLMDLPRSTALRFDLLIHKAFANLVWAYLIGHALLGLLHHLLGHSDLRRMWSLRRD